MMALLILCAVTVIELPPPTKPGDYVPAPCGSSPRHRRRRALCRRSANPS